MAVSNLSSRRSFHWIPPDNHAGYKITVESSSDGVEEDITEYIHYCRVFDGVTDTVGEFEFRIYDPSETYKDKWTGNEIFRYYSDYASASTTLRFRGRIEKPSNRNNMIRVYGRSESLKFLTLNVTKSYTGVEASEILKDIVDTYGDEFTVTNVESTSTNITVSWFEKPFWECVQELCASATSDCYVDADLDFHFFAVSSRSNTGEAFVHGQNLLDIGDFSPDLTQVRNVIRVYGSTQEGTQLIHTEEDATSISSYGRKVAVIRDDNITTQAQIEQVAKAKLANLKDPPIVGEITGTMLSTIQPGQKIYLSSPENNIPPALYDILQYEHTIDLEGGGLTTRVTVNKEPRQTALVFKSIIQRLNNTQDSSINPNQMEYASNNLFNSESGTHVNTEISDGVLRLETGQVSGNWTSDTYTAAVDISQAYLVLTASEISNIIVTISVNGGVSYDTITRESLLEITNSGKSLKINIAFSSATASVDSYSIQYKGGD